MKTTLTRITRRGGLYIGVAALSLLLYNCSSKDLEFIDPYEFVNEEFDELEVTPVADPEPSFEAPETGEVANSEETLAIIADVLGAGTSAEIDPATTAALASIDAVAAELPAEVLAIAENLDKEDLAAILDLSVELDPALIDVVALLDEVSEELRQLLPEIVLVSSVEETIAYAQKRAVRIDLDKPEVMAQALFGPCVEAAEEAYAAAVRDLEIQRDGNIDLIIDNYDRRIVEADTRFDERTALFAEDFTANQAAILVTLEQLLAAADHAEALGDTEVAEDIRILALLYAVDGRIKLTEWEAAVSLLLETTREEEKAELLQIRDERMAQVNANYAVTEAQADTLLVQALSNCHNQGAGN